MPTLPVYESVVWVSIGISFFWFFFTLFSKLLTSLLWIIAVLLIGKAVTHILRAVEWACGVCGSNTNDSETNPINTVAGWNFMEAIFNITSLVFYAGAKATSVWWDAVFAATAVTCWSSRVKSQAAMCAWRSEQRFRVFTGLSTCAALLCSSLQWAFLATCTRSRDEASDMIHYTLIVWTASTSIYLLQSLAFYITLIWRAVFSPDHAEVEFDHMDKMVLGTRVITEAISFIISLVYFQDRLPTIVQFMMIQRFCGLFKAIFMLRRYFHVLSPFPEVHSTGYCVICLEGVKPIEQARRLNCGHVFHTRCLRHWLLRANQCPTCRCPTNQEQSDLFIARTHPRNNNAHHMHDASIQTTFELEYFPQAPAFHGTIRPLNRPSHGHNTIDDSTVVFAKPVDDSNSNLSLQRRVLNNETGAPPPSLPDRLSGNQVRPMALPPGGKTKKSMGGDEFLDNPISKPSKRRGQKRRHVKDGAVDAEDTETPPMAAETFPRKRKRGESNKRFVNTKSE